MAGQVPNGPQQERTLEELYAQHDGKVTDNWSSYLRQYERILAEYRSKPIFLLEIGVQNGGSLEIWGQYFAAARKIVGVDIDPKCSSLAYDDPRIAVVIGDADLSRTQEAVLEQASEFDVIIGDGSHQSGDIVKSFARYFPVLSPGGVYIVENLHCSYRKTYEGGLYQPFSAITFFKRLADIINHEHWGIDKPPTEALRGCFSQYGFRLDQVALETVHSVEFTDSLCVVRKQSSDKSKPLARVVAGSQERVSPGFMELSNTTGPIPDQAGNTRTARSMPPEEELPLRLEEVAEKESRITSLNEELAQHQTEIAQLNDHVAELNQAMAKRDEHISAVHRTITERDRYIKAVDRKLAEHRTQVAELKGQVQQLESTRASANAKVKERDSKLKKREQELMEAHRQSARLRAELKSLYSSRSWRITKPLRIMSRLLKGRWILRNTRRGLRLLGWLATGQFGRAARALLPYYQRFVPSRIKSMMPEGLRMRAKEFLERETADDRWAPARTRRGAPEFTVLPGDRKRDPKANTVLVCGHSAYEHLFGAERSLVDVVEALAALGMNVVVTLPVHNQAYIETLLPLVVTARCFPYPWWKQRRPVDEEVVGLFQRTMLEEFADAVHVNTIMLREPLAAAKRLFIPAIVHAREIIQHDMDLRSYIGIGAEEIAREVAESADYVVVNSEATARSFGPGWQTVVVPNAVDVDDLDLPNEVDPSAVRFALISSNIQKKGVEDVVTLAQLCQTEAPRAQFLLIGPHSEFAERLRKRRGLPDNLQLAGYQRSPREAVSLTNVVLNFSRFAESFGRTVLEGMAARRPAIAYDWGALPELVRHGENGYLVPFGSPEKAVEYVKLLASQPELITRLGTAGRQLAVERYSKKAFTRNLGRVYDAAFAVKAKGDRHADHAMAEGPRLMPGTYDEQTPRISVVVPNYNYSHYLHERLTSIFSQTLRPLEIIFLDDASTDDSLEVAESLLAQSPVPCRIIRHTSNIGTYRQWLKGIEEAKGELVWIAEADDTCGPDMVATLVAAMRDERVAISYCQSKRIDENGAITAPDNLQHTEELDRKRWRKDYRELGLREVVDWLVYRNPIPNVSACLLRKSSISGVESKLAQARFCGDRVLYAHMLKKGDIAYCASPLNCFRRHSSSVTAGRGKSVDLLNEVAHSREYICEHFPIHPAQLPKIIHFLDKDYKVDGVTKNSDYPPVRNKLNAISSRIKGNRRFAFVTTNDNSFDGGSELWWRESSKRLRALGHDVIVLIKKWDPRPPFLVDFDQRGIKSYFKEEQGFQRVIEFQPDLVIVSLGDQDEGIEYYGELQEHGIPYIIVNRLTKEPRFWPIRKDRNVLVRNGYLRAEKVFFGCKNNKTVMEERIGCQLPHWDIIFSPNHAQRDAVLPFPPVSEGVNLAVPARILFVHKAQDLIVEVMKQDKWKQRDVTINLYGTGPDEERLRELVKTAALEDKFVFHGKTVFIGREHEISRMWIHNQAILLPSRMEGISNTVIHAMLSGRVPIVTDSGGHAELVEDDVTGFMASEPSPEALDQAMERAYQRRHEWEAIGRCAKQAMLDYVPEDPVQDAANKILEMVGLETSDRGTTESQHQQGTEQPISSAAPADPRPAGSSQFSAARLAYRDLLTQSLFIPKLHVPYGPQGEYYISFMKSYARVRAQQLRTRPQKELVSIIMPTFNRADCIGDAIRSVLDQSYANWELIIVDDASSDGTDSVVAAFADKRITYVRLEHNMGSAGARNAALRNASGTYITYLDTDNALDPDFLLILIHELAEEPAVDMVYCAQRSFNVENGEEEEQFVRFAPFHWPSVENRNYIDIGTIMHRRSLIEGCGMFNQRMQRLADWEFILRCTAGKGAKAVPAILSNYYSGQAKNQNTRVHSYDDGLAWVDTYARQEPVTKALPHVCLKGIEQMSSLPYDVPEPHARRPVSIVIPSLDAKEYLQACVEAIHAFTGGHNYELIIVDNGSGPSVTSYLENLTEQGHVKVLLNQANLGYFCAVNQGIMSAHTHNDIVVLSNNAIVTQGWLSALQTALSDYPDVGLVTPSQMVLGGERTLPIHRPGCDPQRQCDISISVHHANVLDPRFDIPRGYFELSFAQFFCVYLPRTTIELVGLLEEASSPHYRSDRIYCDIVREQGRPIIYTPHARVYHFVQCATEDLKREEPDGHRRMLVANDWTALAAHANSQHSSQHAQDPPRSPTEQEG